MTPYFRNTEVYNPQTQPPIIVAGVNQHGSISISLFHFMLNTVLAMNGRWLLYPATETLEPIGDGLDPDDPTLLPVGKYVILSPNKQFLDVNLTTERHRPRTLSSDISGTTRENKFRERIRTRDGRCCVTEDSTDFGRFVGFRASHIFPIAHKDMWDMLDLKRHIEDDAPDKAQGPDSINSIQNGLLLRSDIHDSFDAYDIGINADDDYRIYDFTAKGRYDGRTLWINQNVERRYHPSDELLREHFRQCVLANVRGAGRRCEDWMDPEEDHDLSNFKVWGESVDGGQKSRLELEVASRLYLN